MTAPTVRGVHIVGSVPLATVEDVWRTVFEVAPGRLRRISDGEVGERGGFATWQVRKLGPWPAILNDSALQVADVPSPKNPDISHSEQRKVMMEIEAELETQYDTVALQSYQEIQRLRSEGVIPKDTRFMVALPTPLNVTALAAKRKFRPDFEKVYEGKLLSVVENLQSQIPHNELAIQWDCPLEMAMYHGVDIGRDTEPWWEESLLEGIVIRLARLCDSVKDGVEVGIHLCYGDMGGKHFLDPEDTAAMVNVAKGTFEHCRRKVNWLHMPVPKDRNDGVYFEPLRALSQYAEQGLEICLGLVHPEDLAGTGERVRVAGKFVPTFSVASECGNGRGSEERFRSVLAIAAAISEPVQSN